MAKKHRSYEPGRSRARAELHAVRIIFERDSDARALRERDERLVMYAEAHVNIAGIDQMLYSRGLSGIESDAETEYLEEVVTKEWSELRDVLKAVGVSTDRLPLEVDRTWVEWRT